MKNLLPLLAVLVLFAHCNDKKNDKAADKQTENKVEDSITYPYKAEYTSDLGLGDPNHAKLVLDFIKSWEENRFADMRKMLADTVAVDFSDGSKFTGTADSLIKMGEQFRNMFSNVVIKIDAWMPVHSNDRNEDFVLVWEKDYNTDKNGKVDSMGYHNVYQLKNNKIAYWGEFQSKMLPSTDNK